MTGTFAVLLTWDVISKRFGYFPLRANRKLFSKLKEKLGSNKFHSDTPKYLAESQLYRGIEK